jgi:hypothetical protein
MSQALVDTIFSAFANTFGSAELLGLFAGAVLIYFMVVNRIDRGGLALLGVMAFGYACRPPPDGFGTLPPVIFYMVLVAVAAFAYIGFTNIQKGGQS